MSKVSDFKLAESMIRSICKKNNSVFVDAMVSFGDGRSDALDVGETKNIAHTTFKIISQYIKHSPIILGVDLMPDENQRKEFLISLASNLRNLIYDDNAFDSTMNELHAMRLYQFSLVWILLKDIVCPVYNKDLKNLKVICGPNSQVDIAHFYEKGEIKDDNINESFIFVNKIDNRIVQSAFIFIEALRAYGLSPIEVIKGIYESDLYGKFKGLLEIALDSHDDIVDFECAIMAVLGVNFKSLIASKMAMFESNFNKTAQNSVPGLPNQFWYVGVLEKMIEPTRGADWSVYKGLEPYVEQFWNKVEEVKKKRAEKGKDKEIPFDLLLRLKENQTVDYKADPTQTLQALLSSDRVW